MKRNAGSLSDRWKHFWDSKGFALLATMCVAVITATTVWTTRNSNSYIPPSAPTPDNLQAASLLQQRMTDVTSPTPLPTSVPPVWEPPLPTLEVLAPYSEAMTRSPWSGIWMIHDAVDLKAASGTSVKAIAHGKVTAVGDDPFDGSWVQVDHTNGYSSCYSGLSLIGPIKPGDVIRAGQTIGFIGSSALQEAHMEPHLHLQVTHNACPINPMTLFD